jgi:hypothetical protein
MGNENQDSVWLGEVNHHENSMIGATMLIISYKGRAERIKTYHMCSTALLVPLGVKKRELYPSLTVVMMMVDVDEKMLLGSR